MNHLKCVRDCLKETIQILLVGSCYKALGYHLKALEYSIESLEMLKRCFKRDDPSIATLLDYIGGCYQALANNKKALEYSLESLEMKKRLYGILTALSLNHVGMLYS